MDLSAYKTYLDLRGLSPYTINGYFVEISRFFSIYDTFSQDNINQYFLTHKHWKASTRNGIIKALRVYARWANSEVQLPSFQKIHLQARDFLTEPEMLDIANKLQLVFNEGRKYRTIFLLLFYCGLRPKELVNLSVDNIDVKNKILHVTETKGGVDRQLPLTKELLFLLNKEIIGRSEGKVFNVNYNCLLYMCKRINECLSPSIKITPYTLRRSFAHFALEKSKNNICDVSVLMGHTDIKTTYIYLRISQKDVVDKYRKALSRTNFKHLMS